MSRRIFILDGHPDSASERLVHALAEAYRDAAVTAGHEAQLVRLADLEFPVLRSASEYEHGRPTDSVRRVQGLFNWANHVVILYPLWLGEMPALLKALLEQGLRPGFAFGTETPGHRQVKLLHGRSVRIIVTMGMPTFVYRFIFRAHSLMSLKRNILQFVGLRPVRTTLFGTVGATDKTRRDQWLRTVRNLGRTGR